MGFLPWLNFILQQSLRRFPVSAGAGTKTSLNVRLPSNRQRNMLGVTWHFRIFVVMCARKHFGR
jgi:hypothetical protein